MNLVPSSTGKMVTARCGTWDSQGKKSACWSQYDFRVVSLLVVVSSTPSTCSNWPKSQQSRTEQSNTVGRSLLDLREATVPERGGNAGCRKGKPVAVHMDSSSCRLHTADSRRLWLSFRTLSCFSRLLGGGSFRH